MRIRLLPHPALCLLLFCSYFPLSFAGQTHLSKTLDVKNNSPIISLFSLPRADFYPSNKPGTRTLESSFEITNYISSTSKQGDFLLIDGESWSLNSKLLYQYNHQLQIGLSTKWIKHGKGITDRFIYHFHDILQLPQNGRSDEYHERFFWSFYADSQEVLTVRDDLSAWGDTELSLAWQPPELNNTQFNAFLKLPTGDYQQQTGSERVDFSLSFAQQNPDWFSNRNSLNTSSIAFWYGAGLGYTSKVTELSKFTQNILNFSLRTGLAWLVSANWQVKAQIDTHSPLFKTELRELGWFPLQFTIGTDYKVTEDATLNLMIVEDLRPRSAPDVIFSTGLSIKF